MGNMTDYLNWRGDLTFSERPFNMVDNLVLATLSYVDFTGYIPPEDEGGSIALPDAVLALLDETGPDVSPKVRSIARVNEPFLRALAVSKRYASARLRAYADVRDEERSIQFAALTVDLPGVEPYVSFRGTDSSLVGWKENFMLSFSVSPAQKAAAEYLERRVSEGGIVQVGGHSKGGNLAMYAAMVLPPAMLGHISRVWSNDGPGMASEITPEGGMARIADRFCHIIPTYSFVGMFFEQTAVPELIVHSDADGTWQHDPLTWQVVRDEFDWAESLDPECSVLNNTIKGWVDSVAIEDRATFTDEIFDALAAGGATTVYDVTHGGWRATSSMARALLASDEVTKDTLLSLITSARNEVAHGARDLAQERMEEAMELAGERLTDLRDRLTGGEA